MANRYIMKFSKKGYIKYTSHLDLIRNFKRGFKKTGIKLSYSHGYNPHPKMGFAQPLSLGYSSICEYIEFETDESYDTKYISQMMQREMPLGIDIIWCKDMPSNIKSLASDCVAASYDVTFDTDRDIDELKKCLEGYLAQKEIIANKRMKKTKTKEPVNIKDKIKHIDISVSTDNNKILSMALDSGSISNCSPELVIESFLSFANLNLERYKIDVLRKSIEFGNNLQ